MNRFIFDVVYKKKRDEFIETWLYTQEVRELSIAKESIKTLLIEKDYHRGEYKIKTMGERVKFEDGVSFVVAGLWRLEEEDYLRMKPYISELK